MTAPRKVGAVDELAKRLSGSIGFDRSWTPRGRAIEADDDARRRALASVGRKNRFQPGTKKHKAALEKGSSRFVELSPNPARRAAHGPLKGGAL